MTHSRRLRLGVISATGAVLAGIAIGSTLLLERMRDNAHGHVVATVERVGRVVESTVNRQFLAVDGVLAGLPAILAQLGQAGGQLEPATANRALRELNFQNFNFRDLLLLHPDGRPWATALPSSRARPPPIAPAEFAQGGRMGAVAIAGPARNPLTGDWALFFGRPAVVSGIPLIAVAEVPLPLVATLLGAVGEIAGLRISIEREDGQLLASLPIDEQRLSARPVPAINPAARLADGRVHEAAHGDDRPSLRVVRPTLYRGINVVVTYDLGVALTGWRQDRVRLLASAAGAALLLIALAVALTAAMRHRDGMEAVRARARVVLENAIGSMPDGFVMFDPEDRLVVCNARFRALYSVTAPHIRAGMRFEEMVRIGAERGQYPQAGDGIEGFVSDITAWHRGDHPPIERLLPDGRWVLVTERRTPDGGTVGIRTDITALKHAMAELAAARDTAAAATEAKSRFLARMSHELRTPLNGVLGIAQTLAQDTRLPADARAEAQTLEMAGRHLLAVANDVLDLAKVEAGRLELHLVRVDLPALFRTSVALVRPTAEQKRLVLRVQIDPALPDHLLADPTRLRQLLLNLLTNAVKFTPPKGMVELRVLRLAPEPHENAAPRLRIEVCDTGPGVPEPARRAVFGDFVQLKTAGGEAGAGTGLGLAIATHIVEQMQGRIGCTANPKVRDGTGALFWVELPLQAAPAPHAESTPECVTPPGGLPTARRLRILVADDVAANLAVARALLETAGHAVHCVPDGAQAVAAVAESATGEAFDAVLMDIMMPGMDGLEATRRIRALPGPASQLPVLAVTASVFAEDVAACHAAGMDAHIAKPIEREALLATLDRLTGRRPGRDQSTIDRPDGAPPELAPQGAARRSELPWLGVRGPVPDALRGLDPGAALRLHSEFTAELHDATAALAAARDPDAAVAAAHRLAGAAATLELPRLLAAARRLHAADKAAAAGSLRAEVLAIAGDSAIALEAQRMRPAA